MFEYVVGIAEVLNVPISAFLLYVVWRIKTNDLPHIVGELENIKGKLTHVSGSKGHRTGSPYDASIRRQ